MRGVRAADMPLPDSVETPRLVLRRPTSADAEAIFARYASNAEVTRYLAWPTHRTVAETKAFLEVSERAWASHGAGPYLVFTRDGALLGGTGVEVETPTRAQTGYVLAQDAWGQGIATEVVRAVVSVAFKLPTLIRLYAFCHADNVASARVLEKAGFLREGLLRGYAVFPNSGAPQPADCWCYARLREPPWPPSLPP